VTGEPVLRTAAAALPERLRAEVAERWSRFAGERPELAARVLADDRIAAALPRVWACSEYVAGVPATGHRVTPLGPGRCRVDFELSPWVAPYWLVCRIAAARVARLAEADARVGGA
jgi:hypothetical protein